MLSLHYCLLVLALTSCIANQRRNEFFLPRGKQKNPWVLSGSILERLKLLLAQDIPRQQIWRLPLIATTILGFGVNTNNNRHLENNSNGNDNNDEIPEQMLNLEGDGRDAKNNKQRSLGNEMTGDWMLLLLSSFILLIFPFMNRIILNYESEYSMNK